MPAKLGVPSGGGTGGGPASDTDVSGAPGGAGGAGGGTGGGPDSDTAGPSAPAGGRVGTAGTTTGGVLGRLPPASLNDTGAITLGGSRDGSACGTGRPSCTTAPAGAARVAAGAAARPRGRQAGSAADSAAGSSPA